MINLNTNSAYALIDENVLQTRTAGYFKTNDTKTTFTTFSQKPNLTSDFLVTNGTSTDISGVSFLDPYYYSNAYDSATNNTDKNGLLYQIGGSIPITVFEGATTQSFAALSKADGINTFPTISVAGGAATMASIVVDNNQNIYVGGDFTTVNGVARNGFARFDYSALTGNYTLNNTSPYNSDTFKIGYVVNALVINPLTGTVICACNDGFAALFYDFYNSAGMFPVDAGKNKVFIGAMTIDRNDDLYIVFNNRVWCYSYNKNATFPFTLQNKRTSPIYQIKGTTIAVNIGYVYVNNVTDITTQTFYSAGIFNKGTFAIENRFTIYAGQDIGTISVMQRRTFNPTNTDYVYVGGNFDYYLLDDSPTNPYQVIAISNLFYLMSDGTFIEIKNVLDVITALTFDANDNLFYACNTLADGLYVMNDSISKKIVAAPYSPQNTIGTLALTTKTVLMGGAFECQYLSLNHNRGTIVFDISKGIYMGNCISQTAPNNSVKSIVQAANNDIYILYENTTVIKTSQTLGLTTVFTFSGAVNTMVTDGSNNVFFGGFFTSVTVNGSANTGLKNIAIFGSLGDMLKNTSYSNMVSYLSSKDAVRAMTIYQNVMYVGGDQFIAAFDLNTSGTQILTFTPTLSGTSWYVDKILRVLISSSLPDQILLCGSFQGTNSSSGSAINNLALFNLTGGLVWPFNDLNVKTVQAVALDTDVLGGSNYYNLYLSYTTNSNTNVLVVYFTIDMAAQPFPTPPSGVSITAFCIDKDNEMVYYGGAYVSNGQPYINAEPIPFQTGVEVVLPKLQGTGFMKAMLLNTKIPNQLIIGGENTLFANCTKDLNYTASNEIITMVNFNISHVIDLTYGPGCTGTAITDISNNTNVFGGATIDSFSNEIYVGATVNNNSFAVVQYNTDGSKDDTFSFSPVNLGEGCAAHAIAFDNSNNLFVVGKRINGGFDNFTVVDYKNYSSVIPYSDSFNSGYNNTTAYGLAINANNELLVAGNVLKTGQLAQYFVAKLSKSTGQILPVNGFGNAGITQNVVGSNPLTKLNSIVLDTSGNENVVAAGETGSATKMNMLVVRLTNDGSPDVSFKDVNDISGVVIFDMASVFSSTFLSTFSSRAVSAVVVADNQIVVAGNVYNEAMNRYYVCLVKFDTSGNTGVGSDVSTSFGTTFQGISISFGNTKLVVSDMKVSKADNFLVAGTILNTTQSFVKLYNPNGHPIGLITSSDDIGGVEFTQRVLNDATNQIYIATSSANSTLRATAAIESANVVVQKYFNKETLLPQQYFSGTAALIDATNVYVGNMLFFIEHNNITNTAVLRGSVVLINKNYEMSSVTLKLGVTGDVMLGVVNEGFSSIGTLDIPVTLSTIQTNYIHDGGVIVLTVGEQGISEFFLTSDVSMNNYGGGSDISGNANGQLIGYFIDYNKFVFILTVNLQKFKSVETDYYGVFSFAPTTTIPITDPNVILEDTFTLLLETYAEQIANGTATFNIYDSNGTLLLVIPIDGTGSAQQPWPPGPIICFKEGSKILTSTGYVRVEDLVEGHLVMTSRHGLLPIRAVGRSRVYNSGSQKRIKDRLYVYRGLPGLFEDLVLTGLHSVLVDQLSSVEEGQMVAHFGHAKQTDGKYHLLAHKDARAAPYEKKGTFIVYHLALECDDRERHYGIFANGLLAESCSLSHINALHLC